MKRDAVSLALELYDYLSANCYGKRHAVTQRQLAAYLHCPQRMICDLTRILNDMDRPVISTCQNPCGVFIAETPEEMAEYERQLTNRALDMLGRRRVIRNLRRGMQAQAVGQRQAVMEFTA